MTVFDHSVSRRGILRAGAGFAALGAAGSLAAACGNNGATGSGHGPTISQWYHEYGEKGTEQAAKKFASAYQQANVEVNWVVSTQYNNKVATALLGNSAPDCFEDQLTADMVKGKQLVDLSDLIAGVKSDFHPADLALGTVDGKVYGIPMIEDMQMLYYRKSLLRAAGLEPPTSFAELLDASKKLTTGKRKGLFVGNNGGVDVLGGPALYSAGLSYVTPDHKVGFDSPRATTALKQLHALHASGSLLLGAPTDWSDPGSFVNELCAMQWTGLWNLPAIEAKFGDDFGVLPYPALDAHGKPAVPIGDWLAMVSAKSKNVDAAKKFIKWLWVDQTKYQAEWATGFGFHLPVRKSIARSATKLKSGVAADAVSLSKQYAFPASPPDWTPKMSSAYTDVLTSVILEGKDPAGQLESLVNTVQAQLAAT